MKKHIEEMAPLVPCYFAAYPNAGLPDEFGNYQEPPEHFCLGIKTLAEEGLLNIVGGCCGACVEHIRELKRCVSEVAPRELPQVSQALWVSGLDALEISSRKCAWVGERCNISGFRTFRRLITEEKYSEAVRVAREQISAGAQILDVSLDDGLIDSKKAFRGFLRACAEDPYVSRVPLVIDSSNINTIETALSCVQGKSIANSISLKEGEEAFVRNAKTCRKYGASIVVMAVTAHINTNTINSFAII